MCKIDDENNDLPSEFITDVSGMKIDMITSTNKKFVPPTMCLEDLVKEREQETNKLHNMKMYEYNVCECINASGSTNKTVEWLQQ